MPKNRNKNVRPLIKSTLLRQRKIVSLIFQIVFIRYFILFFLSLLCGRIESAGSPVDDFRRSVFRKQCYYFRRLGTFFAALPSFTTTAVVVSRPERCRTKPTREPRAIYICKKKKIKIISKNNNGNDDNRSRSAPRRSSAT